MGRIVYKTAKDLDKMREAGFIVSTALAAMRDAVAPGVSTYDLDQLAHEIVRRHGGHPSFLGYKGYPASICASINEEVVHGIPNKQRKVKEGDIISIDIGVRLKGFHADSALTVPVGNVSDEVQRLLRVTQESLWQAIRAVQHRGRLKEVCGAVQEHVEKHGYSIVREMVGHGVGKHLHEDPQVPNYVDQQHPNPPLLEGMTLAIEPMVNAGVAGIEILPDGWTVVTADRKYSAHFEHTVAVTRHGYEILTLGPHDSGEWQKAKAV